MTALGLVKQERRHALAVLNIDKLARTVGVARPIDNHNVLHLDSRDCYAITRRHQLVNLRGSIHVFAVRFS